MTIEFHCPGCDAFLRVSDGKAGFSAACPHCEESLVVPMESERVDPRDEHFDEVDEYDEYDDSRSPRPRGTRFPPVQHDRPYGPAPSSGLAITSMVLGIIGLVFVCVIYITIPCSVLAIIFGWIAISQSKTGRAGGKGMAIAGLVCGLVAMSVYLIIFLFVAAALQQVDLMIF